MIGYGFTAWLLAALVVYAAPPTRYAAIGGVFWTVFRFYFLRPDPMHPAAAAVLTLGIVAGIDLALIAPYYLHPMDLFASFWDWQLPALIALGAILAAGKRPPGPVRVLQNR